MANPKHVTISEPSSEQTPLVGGVDINDPDDDDDEYDEFGWSSENQVVRRESIAADRLSERLLAIDDDDDAMEDLILHETLNVDKDTPLLTLSERERRNLASVDSPAHNKKKNLQGWLCSMVTLFVVALGLIGATIWTSVRFIGPPNRPVGAYQLVEAQEGEGFFDHYTFWDGPDSVGSNGYISYVSRDRATTIGIASVTDEPDALDGFFQDSSGSTTSKTTTPKKPFVYLKTAPTEAGPRESVRLEGKKRFNRGLFIIDIRHVPIGCGTWPAFWLTDEARWPVNGEIDIVEGVNFQTETRTALHTTKGCDMFDVPVGSMSGTWDTAVGIPDRKTGIPDTTFREARNCFVYDPHQWINQGCVAIDRKGGSYGEPLNDKGGGIFVMEWDPAYRHIRTWVFAPHTRTPENLVKALRSASAPVEDDIVVPNPDEWPLPYGYFPIGEGTNCEGTKFRNMRLVLNIALCGSVAGNRFFRDCTNESQTFHSCDEYIKSRPEALKEAYWKIRGVYVYQREWQKAWLGH